MAGMRCLQQAICMKCGASLEVSGAEWVGLEVWGCCRWMFGVGRREFGGHAHTWCTAFGCAGSRRPSSQAPHAAVQGEQGIA